MKKTTGKIAVMGASFALFLCGAGALQLERGTAQTVILAVVFAGLLTIAGVQTFRRIIWEKWKIMGLTVKYHIMTMSANLIIG